MKEQNDIVEVLAKVSIHKDPTNNLGQLQRLFAQRQVFVDALKECQVISLSLEELVQVLET